MASRFRLATAGCGGLIGYVAATMQETPTSITELIKSLSPLAAAWLPASVQTAGTAVAATAQDVNAAALAATLQAVEKLLQQNRSSAFWRSEKPRLSQA